MTFPDLGTLPDWMARGACVGLPGDMFFPRQQNTRAVRAAKDACAACPVTTQCLALALSNENAGADIDEGIYGGTTAAERRRLTRRRTAP